MSEYLEHYLECFDRELKKKKYFLSELFLILT